jgi:signal transduction histidine kinase
MLQEDHGAELDEEGRRLCVRMREDTTQMSALIDDLLRFSRLRSSALRREVVDMQALTTEAFVHVATPAEGERTALTVEALPSAEGDPAMLRQVLENLFTNALKFTRDEPEPRITVSAVGAKEPEGLVWYTVRDNGVGFEPAYQDKLFQLFERLHGAEYEGTGAGLAIAKRIVEAHGGRMRAESELGEWAAFSFSLPAPGLPAPATPH